MTSLFTETLIFYLPFKFCSSKTEYSLVIGCCSHPSKVNQQQRCLKSKDWFFCVWTQVWTLQESKALVSASWPWVYRSLCMLKLKRNSFGLYPDSDFSVTFYVNKLSSFTLPPFFYTHQSILDLYPTAPMQFPFTMGIPHSLFLAGLRLFHATCQAWHIRHSWPDSLDDFYLWLWKQKAFIVPCIILAWKSLFCLWSGCRDAIQIVVLSCLYNNFKIVHSTV